jgi:hypothetical protein
MIGRVYLGAAMNVAWKDSRFWMMFVIGLVAGWLLTKWPGGELELPGKFWEAVAALGTIAATVVALWLGTSAQRAAESERRTSANLLLSMIRPQATQLQLSMLMLIGYAAHVRANPDSAQAHKTLRDYSAIAETYLALPAADRYFELLATLGEVRAEKIASILSRIPLLAALCKGVAANTFDDLVVFGEKPIAEMVIESALEIGSLAADLYGADGAAFQDRVAVIRKKIYGV